MDQTYDDEDTVKRAFDQINELKAKSIKDSEEAVEPSENDIDANTVGQEACRKQTSFNVDTPVLGNEGSQTDSGDIQTIYNMPYIKEINKQTTDQRVERKSISVVSNTQTLHLEPEMPADPIESQNTEDQAFLKDCLNELREFIEEQIQHLTEQIPPEVIDPRPQWPAENNSSVGKDLPKYKASFMGHIIDVKLKQGLYPSRLKLFNQNNSSRLLINELYNASRIYDSVYKVRTELSKAINQPRVETKIRQQSPEIDYFSMQDLLNVTKIATTFDSKDFVQNTAQKKEVHSINVFAQPSPMLSPRERHILQKNQTKQNIFDHPEHQHLSHSFHKGNQSITILDFNSPRFKNEDVRRQIKINRIELMSPEIGSNQSFNNIVDIFTKVIDTQGNQTSVPATAEGAVKIAYDKSTTVLFSPPDTGDFTKKGALLQEVNADLKVPTTINIVTSNVASQGKKVHQTSFEFPGLTNVEETNQAEKILENRMHHFVGKKQRNAIQNLNKVSIMNVSQQSKDDHKEVGNSILYSTLQTQSQQSSGRSQNILQEFVNKPQLAKGLARIEGRKQSSQIRHQEGLIYLGKIQQTSLTRNLTQNDSAGTIKAEPLFQEKQIGQSSGHFTLDHQSVSPSTQARATKQLSPKHASQTDVVNQELENLRNGNLQKGVTMTAQSPMETLHRNSQGASESNYGPFKANANDTGLLMKLMAGENEMLIKTQEIQRTLIDTQTGKESSGISQLEQYQKVSESKMKLIALPFKSIAMPDRGVSPNDTSISQKLKSTNLQYSVMLQRERQRIRQRVSPDNSIGQLMIAPVMKNTSKETLVVPSVDVVQEHLPTQTQERQFVQQTDITPFTSGADTERDMIMRQTASERSTIDVHAEARAASQLENPLDSINNDKDEVAQFTVTFPLNATQPSFSPVKKTKISKAEKTIAIEGSPTVTRGRKKRERNMQTDSYSRDVLLADAHIQSPPRNLVPFILQIKTNNSNVVRKSPEKKQADQNQPIEYPHSFLSNGKSTLMEDYGANTPPLSVMPSKFENSFHKTTAVTIKENHAVTNRISSIFAQSRNKKGQTHYAAQREEEKLSLSRKTSIANNFQVSPSQTRNPINSRTVVNHGDLLPSNASTLVPSNQGVSLVHFGANLLPPIRINATEASTVLKPLKYGTHRFSMKQNVRSSLAQTIASSTMQVTNNLQPTRANEQTSKIKSGTVVHLSSLSKERVSKDQQIIKKTIYRERKSPNNINSTEVTQHGPQSSGIQDFSKEQSSRIATGGLKIKTASNDTPVEVTHQPIVQTLLAFVEGQSSREQAEPVLAKSATRIKAKPPSQSPSRSTNRPQVETQLKKHSLSVEHDSTNIAPWSKDSNMVDVGTSLREQSTTPMLQLPQLKMMLPQQTTQPQSQRRSVWLDNVGFTGFDLSKMMQKKQIGEQTTQLNLEGNSVALVLKQLK